MHTITAEKKTLHTIPQSMNSKVTKILVTLQWYAMPKLNLQKALDQRVRLNVTKIA